MNASIRMYILSWCGYCHAARRLLDSKGIEYDVVDVTGDNDTRAWLRSATGSGTLPQTFIHEQPVGGYTDLLALDRDGQLDKLIEGP